MLSKDLALASLACVLLAVAGYVFSVRNGTPELLGPAFWLPLGVGGGLSIAAVEVKKDGIRARRAGALAVIALLLFVPTVANAQAGYQIVAQYEKTYAIFDHGEIIEKFVLYLYPKENDTVLWNTIWPYQSAQEMKLGETMNYQTPQSTFTICICEITESYVVIGWTVLSGDVEIADPELRDQGQQGQAPETPNHPVVAVAWPTGVGGTPGPAPTAAYATTEQVSRLREQIAELNATIKQLRQEITQLKQQTSKGGASQEDLNRLQAKVAALDSKVQELSSQIEALTQAIGEVKKDVESVKATALVSGDLQEDLQYLVQHDKAFAGLAPMYQWLLSSNQVPDQLKTQLVQVIHQRAEEVRHNRQMFKYVIIFGVPSVAALLIFLIFKIKWRTVENAEVTVVPEAEPGPMK